MKRTATTRPRAGLDTKLDVKLMAYVAAGVGAITAVQSAQAKIVYTPASISVGRDAGEIPIDVNNDGIPDFKLSNYQTMEAPLGFKNFFLNVRPAWKGNGVVDYFNSKNMACASALPARQQVGPQSPFNAEASFILERSTGSAYSTAQYCPWAGNSTHKAYLGVRFNIGGQMHYGWIRMTVVGFSSIAVTGYAYETVPNKAISTGATSGPDKFVSQDLLDSSFPPPASLGLLARGAEGLQAWRRRDNGAQI